MNLDIDKINDLIDQLLTVKEGSERYDKLICDALGIEYNITFLAAYYGIRVINPTQNLYAVIDLQKELLPNWRRFSLHTPGYTNGSLIAPYRVELHHALSSGGGPRVIAFGQTEEITRTIAVLMAIKYEYERDMLL